jgi:hypothetical protein
MVDRAVEKTRAGSFGFSFIFSTFKKSRVSCLLTNKPETECKKIAAPCSREDYFSLEYVIKNDSVKEYRILTTGHILTMPHLPEQLVHFMGQ